MRFGNPTLMILNESWVLPFADLYFGTLTEHGTQSPASSDLRALGSIGCGGGLRSFFSEDILVGVVEERPNHQANP